MGLIRECSDRIMWSSVKDWKPITDKAEPGDLICVNHLDPTSVLSDAIKWFENGHVSHCCCYIGNGNIVEAEAMGIKISPLSEYLDDKHQLILRRLNVPGRDKIADVAQTHVGKGYDFKTIGLVAIYKLAGKVGLSRMQLWIGKKFHGWRKSYTCSEEYCLAAWQAVGIDLAHAKDFDLVTPQDLLSSPLLDTVSTV